MVRLVNKIVACVVDRLYAGHADNTKPIGSAAAPVAGVLESRHSSAPNPCGRFGGRLPLAVYILIKYRFLYVNVL